jgi:hypothetical protein
MIGCDKQMSLRQPGAVDDASWPGGGVIGCDTKFCGNELGAPLTGADASWPGVIGCDTNFCENASWPQLLPFATVRAECFEHIPL